LEPFLSFGHKKTYPIETKKEAMPLFFAVYAIY
jgi:hypothetical protein